MKDESKVDGVSVPKGQSGNYSQGVGDGGNKDHQKESDRKGSKKDQDSQSASEPKKPADNPASNFSSTSKLCCSLPRCKGENEGEDYTE